jgi:uncharacterized circularly permuted ATP-grasp superfamily protein/uncharacterized alpha-E superfamily protein
MDGHYLGGVSGRQDESGRRSAEFHCNPRGPDKLISQNAMAKMHPVAAEARPRRRGMPLVEEFRDVQGQIASPYRALFAAVERFSRQDLIERQHRVDAASVELGIHFAPLDGADFGEQSLDLDIFPRLLGHGEWNGIAQGIVQRVRAFNALLADVYGAQRILHDKILPYRVLFDDPAYLRGCLNLPVPSTGAILFGAVDLVRDAQGQWSVLQNHFSAPVGASYVLQHRRMLAQAVPELFQSQRVEPLAEFTTVLLEALAGLAKRENPLIVLLTRGENDFAYFEETFLARRMGVAVVRPADLLVRDSQVFLKTVGGLERVDVIYRRVEGSSVDPIAFDQKAFRGVPGLVHCMRKGTVAVANSLGSGIADNKALLRYSDAIIHYYLKQRPLLPSVETFVCADRDQLDYVSSELGDMVLKPVHRETESGGFHIRRRSMRFQAEMREMLQTSPGRVVAQRHLAPSASLRLGGGKRTVCPVFLRAFVVMGETPYVLPGGLSMQMLPEDGTIAMPELCGGAQDTWILGDDNEEAVPARRPQALHRPRDIRIGSRVAEALYWMGRYLERADNAARMINVLEEVALESDSPQKNARLWPLWQAVAAANGKKEWLKIKRPPEDISLFSRSLVLDKNDASSVRHCAEAIHANAQDIREFITPEVWRLLSRFHLWSRKLPDPARAVAGKSRSGRNLLRDICQQVQDTAACIHGTAERTMPHDDGWEFFLMGKHIERAIGTITVLEIVLTRSVAISLQRREENPDLTALLRILGSLDAYRREYRSRAYVGQVAELLWKNAETPSSAAYCFRQLEYSLRRVAAAANPGVLGLVEGLRRYVDTLSCEELFPEVVQDSDGIGGDPELLSRMKGRISEESAVLRRKAESLHQLVEDTFLSHQGPPA